MMTHDDWMPQVGPRKYTLEPLRPKITSHHRTMDFAGGQEESARGRQCTGPLRVEKNVARETNGRRREKGNAPKREGNELMRKRNNGAPSIATVVTPPIGACARCELLSILFKKQWMMIFFASLIVVDRDKQRRSVDLEGGELRDWKGSSVIHLARSSALTEMRQFC
ncbi:hypothetical protein BO79DRAFT_241507 [Aspergillus costaricaensis CBS 115574]|uniref:Uncharacterized protein n=1 Tax=Aspergillus costaricaensis CBS 115574 TaxID=1448317 RepID=A0ACD1HZR0_9EURO|nr:hypothetical protein BO79DRAFT_241507 [Aspergillus costaricaensis CBS 115574]RAK83000.1 hypothetical protein BO79DRAFT_241507 [Aspergillus costaricaensis CBS 115574]